MPSNSACHSAMQVCHFSLTVQEEKANPHPSPAQDEEEGRKAREGKGSSKGTKGLCIRKAERMFL